MPLYVWGGLVSRARVADTRWPPPNRALRRDRLPERVGGFLPFPTVATPPAARAFMWGRFATCGQFSIGLPFSNGRSECGHAASERAWSYQQLTFLPCPRSRL